MTLVAVCSVKGSPGVTTAAVGLAACWPAGQQPVVVEADPAGGDLLARLRLGVSPGLVSLAAAARHGAEPGLIWAHTQRLPGGLPVVVGPAGAEQARAALAQLTRGDGGVLRRAADWTATAVIADCGRMEAQSAAAEVVRAADVTLVLARARDDALSHLATSLAAASGWLGRARFVLVGEGYPTPEVADALGIEVLGRIPEDAAGAAVLEGRPARRSAPSRSALLRALEPIATAVAHQAHLMHQERWAQPQGNGETAGRTHHDGDVPTPDAWRAESGAPW